MEIVNLTQDKVTLTQSKGEYITDFGRIAVKTDARATLLLKTEEEVSKDIFTMCGCTTPTLSKVEGGYTLTIGYSNRTLGKFTKTIKIRLGKKRREVVIKIKGDTYGV